MSSIIEQLIEGDAAASLAALGYSVLTRTQVDDAGERPDLAHFLLQSRLRAALHRLSPLLSNHERDQILRLLAHPAECNIIQNNRWFHAFVADHRIAMLPIALADELQSGRLTPCSL